MATDGRPLVGVVVLNWNNLQDTMECLASLLASDYPAVSVWLVDNASVEDPTEQVARHFPSVRIARQKENLGYAGGNNAGIRVVLGTTARYVQLLNNDVVVAPDMISRLVEVAESHPDAGFITPRIRIAGENRVYWDGGSINWATGDVSHDSSALPLLRGIVKSEWSNGCAPLIRVKTIEDVGLMDERLFLYYEDVEWSTRAARRGWTHLVVLGAICWHKVSRSTGGIWTPASRFYFARNRYRVLREYSPMYRSRWRFSGYCLRLLRDYWGYRRDKASRLAVIEALWALLTGTWGTYQPATWRVKTSDVVFYAVGIVAAAVRRVSRLWRRRREVT